MGDVTRWDEKRLNSILTLKRVLKTKKSFSNDRDVIDDRPQCWVTILNIFYVSENYCKDENFISRKKKGTLRLVYCHPLPLGAESLAIEFLESIPSARPSSRIPHCFLLCLRFILSGRGNIFSTSRFIYGTLNTKGIWHRNNSSKSLFATKICFWRVPSHFRQFITQMSRRPVIFRAFWSICE